MSNYLKGVNRTVVSADLLGEVLEMYAAMSAKDRPIFEARAAALLDLLDRKGLDNDWGDVAVAIDFRLTALARLQKVKTLRGWMMPGNKPGMDYFHAALVKAAAMEPLVEDATGRPVFDAESFRRRVVTNVATRARA